MVANGSKVILSSLVSAMGNSLKGQSSSELFDREIVSLLMTSKGRISHYMRCGVKSFKKAVVLVAVEKRIQCACIASTSTISSSRILSFALN